MNIATLTELAETNPKRYAKEVDKIYDANAQLGSAHWTSTPRVDLRPMRRHPVPR